MNGSNVYLYGAGGHACVVREILELQGVDVSGFIDDDVLKSEKDGLPVLHKCPSDCSVIIAVGNSKSRLEISRRLTNTGVYGYGVAIHPAAVVSTSAIIGDGSVVMPGAIINAKARIGKHCVINTGAVVDHECVVSDFVNICPHTTLCGNVFVGEGANVCAGSIVVQGMHIGKWSVVGAGSLCRHNIPDGVVVVGSDCHVIRQSFQM